MAASRIHCLVDVVPIKNEEGIVIMFILNFEDLAVLIAKSARQSLHQRLTQGWHTGERSIRGQYLLSLSKHMWDLETSGKLKSGTHKACGL